MDYLLNLKTNEIVLKNKLDSIIREFKGQPVGDGYIDIILHRNYFKECINELTQNGFLINAVSWWQYCRTKEEWNNKKGYGGPGSIYFEGWFSELSHDFDEIADEIITKASKDNPDDFISLINSDFLTIIENKVTITYSDGTCLDFSKDHSLTPGIWLYLPENWKSNTDEMHAHK